MSSHSIRIAQLGREPRHAEQRAGVWTTLAAMWQARRSRQMLASLDDRLLSDIGLGRGDAVQEASRPMWDIATR